MTLTEWQTHNALWKRKLCTDPLVKQATNLLSRSQFNLPPNEWRGPDLPFGVSQLGQHYFQVRRVLFGVIINMASGTMAVHRAARLSDMLETVFKVYRLRSDSVWNFSQVQAEKDMVDEREVANNIINLRTVLESKGFLPSVEVLAELKAKDKHRPNNRRRTDYKILEDRVCALESAVAAKFIELEDKINGNP